MSRSLSNDPFSSTNRHAMIQSLATKHVDLLVVGGGITGCGIALDAASRGLSVALVEKKDFASGTSSKSTKLIHGGLRYLKQLEFGLVREVGSERAVVHRLAPHLVVPEKMLLPLYEKRGLGYWLTSLGLKIYDLLAGVSAQDQRRMLTRKQTVRSEPLLDGTNVKGGALYAEYRTDDARLTIEIAKTAVRHGAVLVSYMAAENFEYDGHGKIARVQLRDMLTSREIAVTSPVVVNAAGPWVDDLRKADHSLIGKRLHLSKGVHIVVPRERLPVTQAIYFDVESDGRMIFAIPRGRVTYIGTTDTTFTGDKDDVNATVDDAVYLLDAVNNTFPGIGLSIEDVESSWAGLRPLIHEDGKPVTDLSRKDEIFISQSGLISIAGGKLTGYRRMSERVVDLVFRRFIPEKEFKPCVTAKLTLTEHVLSSTKHDVSSLPGTVRDKLAPYGFASYVGTQLIENFGSNAISVLEIYLRIRGEHKSEMLSLLEAQLHYCIDHEMVLEATDFFIRRTGLLYFDLPTVTAHYHDVLAAMADLLNWTASQKEQQVVVIQQLLAKAQMKTVR